MILSTDAIDFALDPITHDFPPPGQNIDVSSGVSAVVQGCYIRLLMTAGEWFLDLDFGVARFARDGVDPSRVIFGAKFQAARAQREYRRAMLGDGVRPGVPGLLDLVQLDVTFDNRTRTQKVVFQGRTIFGDTPIVNIQLGAS